MAPSQKSKLHFVRKMMRLGVPSTQWNELYHAGHDIRSASNLINFSLLTEQAAGIFAGLGVTAFFGVFNQLFLKGMLHNQILHQNAELVTTILNCCVYVVYMFVPFLVFSFAGRLHPAKSIHAGRVKQPWLIFPAIPITYAVYLVAQYLNSVIITLMRSVHLEPVPAMVPTAPRGLLAYVFFCIQLCVLAPIFEEILFRGLIMRRLLKYGAPFAIVVSALLFGMLHGNMSQIPFAFMMGLALGYFAYRLGSVRASILLHALVNGTSLALDAFSKQIQQAFQPSNVLFIGAGVFAGLILFVLSLMAFTSQGFRAREEVSDTPRVPASMAWRSFVLTPGFGAFALLTVVLVVYVTRVL